MCGFSRSSTVTVEILANSSRPRSPPQARRTTALPWIALSTILSPSFQSPDDVRTDDSHATVAGFGGWQSNPDGTLGSTMWSPMAGMMPQHCPMDIPYLPFTSLPFSPDDQNRGDVRHARDEYFKSHDCYSTYAKLDGRIAGPACGSQPRSPTRFDEVPLAYTGDRRGCQTDWGHRVLRGPRFALPQSRWPHWASNRRQRMMAIVGVRIG